MLQEGLFQTNCCHVLLTARPSEWRLSSSIASSERNLFHELQDCLVIQSAGVGLRGKSALRALMQRRTHTFRKLIYVKRESRQYDKVVNMGGLEKNY